MDIHQEGTSSLLLTLMLDFPHPVFRQIERGWSGMRFKMNVQKHTNVYAPTISCDSSSPDVIAVVKPRTGYELLFPQAIGEEAVDSARAIGHYMKRVSSTKWQSAKISTPRVNVVKV